MVHSLTTSITRGDGWAVLGLTVAVLVGLVVAFRVAPSVDWRSLGNRNEVTARQALFLDHFYDNEAAGKATGSNYRWSQPASSIIFPSLGRGWWLTTLTLSGQRPSGAPTQTQIAAGGQTVTVPLSATYRSYSLLLPAPSGQLGINLHTPGYIPQHVDPRSNDPRELGVVLSDVSVLAAQPAIQPPLAAIAMVLLTILLMYLTLRLIGLGPSWAALPAVAIILIVAGLQHDRLVMGVYLPRLLLGSLAGLALMLVARWASTTLFRWGGVELTARAQTWLLLIIYIGFLLKTAGLLWPYFEAIDIPWHMEKTERVLNGRIAELWNADSPFHQSVMPDLWGSNKPVIPYSPFYHIASAVWAIFPWRLELSANTFSAAIDSLRPLLIAFTVRKFGFRERAALLGALVYSVIPASYLMHAWGNTPTTTGMWLSFAAMVVLVAAGERLATHRRAWLLLTVMLTLAMLFYAVTAVFTTLVIAGVVVGLLVTRQRRFGLALLASLAAAIGLSTAIYYWQFVGPILARTIPRLTGSLEQGGTDLGVEPMSWGAFVWKYVYLLDIYGVYLPLGLGIVGWWLGIRKLGARSLFALLMTCWMVVAIFFWFVGFRVDMVDKQLFWLMPWMGIGAGIAIDRWLASPRAVRWAAPLIVLCMLYLGGDSLYFWLYRVGGTRGFTSFYQVLRQYL